MHVLFLAPETSDYNLRFVDALKRAGARVSGIGHKAREQLSPELARRLDRYERVQNLFDGDSVVALARECAQSHPIDRVETIDEPAVGPAAYVRSRLGAPGVSIEQARLCRDKAAMKDALRAHDIPCAVASAVASRDEARAFAEREGFPLVIKPREGFGTLRTFRVENQAELARALDVLQPSPSASVVVEEFVEGHEGFYDSIVAAGGIAHAFIGHYYPSCLEALGDRRIRPEIACTNRVDAPSYADLHATMARVVTALSLVDCATHIEWFFGPKGLKISEIGARPAGERIWDMHAAGNEFDVYMAWAEAVLHGRGSGVPTRRFATGSVQIRPERDGHYAGHAGVDEVFRALGDAIFEHEIPAPGAPTRPLEAGWHAGTWFRLRDESYDRLRERLDFVGRTVRIQLR